MVEAETHSEAELPTRSLRSPKGKGCVTMGRTRFLWGSSPLVGGVGAWDYSNRNTTMTHMHELHVLAKAVVVLKTPFAIK